MWRYLMLLHADKINSDGNVWEKFIIFFKNFDWINGLEIVLLFCMLYYVSGTLRKNGVTRLMIGYWALMLALSLVTCFTDIFNAQMYLLTCILVSMFMLILFSTEIKKELWDRHTPKAHRNEKNSAEYSENSLPNDVNYCIMEITDAIMDMAHNRTGALIVLANSNYPRSYLYKGTILNADISKQIIQTVFYPGTPLHDGAMVICNHKIYAAGCFLPLTEKTYIPQEVGTRHRAAIGITERCNVKVLVVSEETGMISIVNQGVIRRCPDKSDIERELKSYYWKDLATLDSEKKKHGKFTRKSAVGAEESGIRRFEKRGGEIGGKVGGKIGDGQQKPGRAEKSEKSEINRGGKE